MATIGLPSAQWKADLARAREIAQVPDEPPSQPSPAASRSRPVVILRVTSPPVHVP